MHAQTVVDGLEGHLALAELGTRCERHDCRCAAGDHARQVGAAGVDVVRQIVDHREARPAGHDRHRRVDVPLAQRKCFACRADREMTGGVAAEEMGEDRGRIRLRMAQPGDGAVWGHQRLGTRTCEHRESFDRRGVRSRKPRAAFLEEECQGGDHVLGAIHPVLGDRLAFADLDTHIGPCREANAFSSVTSSPKNTAALEASWCRMMSSALPLSVGTTDSSITALLR